MNKENFNDIEAKCKARSASLIAVSKTRSTGEIKKLYDLGCRNFGENRVQEFLEKLTVLPDDINWHLIGHLQRKKVKKIIGKAQLIHSVDSFALLEEINKFAERNKISTSILLQFKIAQEETKYGFDFESFCEKFNPQIHLSDYVSINGVMGMATFTSDEEMVRMEFKKLHSIFTSLKTDLLKFSTFKEISMGMSGDFQIALEEGSTMLRIGTLIFGSRK